MPNRRWTPYYAPEVAAYAMLAVSIALVFFAYLGRLPAVDHPLDDAFISFRYALHTAQGHWLEWNRGEAPSEGFTNLSLVALLALGTKLGIPPAIGAFGINIASTVATAVGILVLCQFVQRGIPSLALIAVALWLGDPKTAYSTGTGLETQFNVFLLIAQLLLVWRLLENPSRGVAVASALVALVAGVTRPESAIFCALAYAPLAIVLLQRRDYETFGLSIVLYGFLGLGFLVWKLSFFGYLLPNAFYIKSVDPSELIGFDWVVDFVRYNWIILGLALLSIPVLVARGFTAQVLCAVVPLLFGLVYFATVLHEMAPHFRYEAPVYGYATVVAAAGLHALSPQDRLGRAVALGLTFLGVWAAIFEARHAGPLPRSKTPSGPPMVWFSCAGKALGSTGLGHDATLHTGAAGRLPYESDFYHVDVGAGIVENALCGRHPVTREEKGAYIRGKPADVVFSETPPALAGSQEPGDDAAFRSPYVQGVTLGKTDRFSTLRQYRLRNESLDRRSQGTWNAMKSFRDNFIVVGRSPVETRRGVRHYAYVSRTSEHRDALVEALRSCYSLPAIPDEERPAETEPRPDVVQH